jgi:Uma2 family endonuclease
VVYLLIEVADTTLKRDQDVKALLYAKAGILEYWVLDVINRQIYLFRNPSPDGYQDQRQVAEGDVVTLVAWRDRAIAVSELLRSQV